jgi:hypothetical protein
MTHTVNSEALHLQRRRAFPEIRNIVDTPDSVSRQHTMGANRGRGAYAPLLPSLKRGESGLVGFVSYYYVTQCRALWRHGSIF